MGVEYLPAPLHASPPPIVLPTLRSSSLRATGVVLLLTTLGGCRHVLLEKLDWAFPVVTRDVRDPVADDLRDVNWIRDRDWTADSASESTRWIPAPRQRSDAPDRPDRKADETWPPASPTVDVAPQRIGLEQLVETSPQRLRRWVGDDGLVGWNAAILLAGSAPEHADEEVERVLRHLVRERPRFDPTTGLAQRESWFRLPTKPEPDASEYVRISESMQAAAAEAWVTMRGSTAADPIEALAEIGRLLEQRTLPQHVRGELYRGIAIWVEPPHVPHLEAAVGEEAREHTSPELRRAAVEACVVHATRHRFDEGAADDGDRWPRRLREMETDPDPGVRAAFGRWIALVRAPDAVEILRRQLDDTSPRVRESAIGALAILASAPGGPDGLAEETRDELLDLAGRSEPRIRAMAVTALARVSPNDVVLHAEDESAFVREAVAKSLAASPSSESCRILITLASDRSLQVEAAAVAAVDDWPDALAAPVLFQAMELGRTATRGRADAALRRRVGGSYGFRQLAPIAERRRALAEIARRYGLPSTPPPIGLPSPLVEEQRERDIASDLADVADPEARSVAIERLQSLDEREVGLLERLLVDATQEVRAIVSHEVLAEVSPVHAALDEMERGDRRERLDAARRLARLAADAPLSPYVVKRLHGIVVEGESDRDVWRAVLEAVERDGGEDGARIVQLGLGFRWPDVQRLACESIEANPRPKYAMWLIPLLEDPDRSVRIAAIRAAGSCRNPAVVEGVPTADGRTRTGLRPLLRDEDAEVRKEVAIALATLGDSDGLREVDRLAHSPEPNVRREAVDAMVRSGNPGFVDVLIELSANDGSSRVRQDALAALLELVPEHERPKLPSTTRAPDAAARVWATWRDRRSRPAVTSQSTASVPAASVRTTTRIR